MKTGRSLTELAKELERQNDAKRDYVANTSALVLVDASTLRVADKGSFSVSDHTHGQVAQHLDIPKKYYDKMRVQAPELLENNVNYWFQEKPAKRLVRTMDGQARAFLSDRYRPYDNWDVAENCLQAFQDANCEV
jgi:hypothetical protein